MGKMNIAQQLDSIVKNEDNRYCVDCGAKGPRWASVNLGYVFDTILVNKSA